MKKLLLILLCVPLIGFGQIDYRNWDDVYADQKHNNLDSLEHILKEFGTIKWNNRYNRYEALLKLDDAKFESSSGQYIFLESFDGNVYTYIDDIRIFDLNKALVILYSVGYERSGYLISGDKYAREEVHFALMEKNQSDMWDVKEINTMDIHTSDDGGWLIGLIEYVENYRNDLLDDKEKRLMDLGVNSQWVLYVTSSGGHMGEYWRDHYCYSLKDLTMFILSQDVWYEDVE